MKSQDSIAYYQHHARRSQADPASLSYYEEGVLKPFLSELKPGAKVLDLGCGAGLAVSALRKQGWQAYGLDASEAMIEAARQWTGLPDAFEIKNVLFWSPKKQEWDGIWIQRTFQHLTAEEAQRVVGSVFFGLQENGTLGVVVPEGQGTFEDRSGDWTGPSRWIHRYQEKQICSMLEQTGFRVLSIGKRTQTSPGKFGMGPENELMVIARRWGRV